MGIADAYVQGQTIHVSGYIPKIVNYSNATYIFTCLAKPGTGLTEAKWRIFREEISTGNITHASGYENFSNVATDLSTVNGLSYS